MGFGNRLYPWARCHLHSSAHKVPMLAPHWWWPPRVRPLLAHPPAPRELPGHLYLQGIRTLPEYVSGARAAVIEATSRGNLLVFRGEAGRFADLQGHEAVLKDALQRMSTAVLPPIEAYVGMHVRRGDFSAQARTSDAWFIAALRAIRIRIGREVPAIIVSDATQRELQSILRESNVRLLRTHAPLGDLLVLAGARLLLASGSSFSAWAAFLGGMPGATAPEHSLGWFGLRARSFLGHFDPGQDNSQFVEAAAAVF